MPTRPPKPCRALGCSRLTHDTYCDEHAYLDSKQLVERHRASSSSRGYDRRWRKARLCYLREHPLCVECQRHGRVTPATVVDHIQPHRGNRDLFWDVENWQPLCKGCHDKKTAREISMRQHTR